MNQPIKFYIPNFLEFYDLNISLIKLIKEKSYYFYDNISIGAVFGTVPKVIWNGGRAMHHYIEMDIKKIIKGYNDLNIPIRFTFTNCLLEKQHLSDPYGNIVMRYANNGLNEVLINSPILENYLRKKYPNFKYISSITKVILEDQDIIDEVNKYDMTVLDTSKNRDFNLLKSLDPNKIELLINSYCMPNCPYKKQHYESVSQSQLIGCNDLFGQKCCNRQSVFENILGLETVIKKEELYNIYYNQLHIYNFKIEGRNNNINDVINNYLYYMVKPEYYEIIKQIFKERIQTI